MMGRSPEYPGSRVFLSPGLETAPNSAPHGGPRMVDNCGSAPSPVDCVLPICLNSRLSPVANTDTVGADRYVWRRLMRPAAFDAVARAKFTCAEYSVEAAASRVPEQGSARRPESWNVLRQRGFQGVYSAASQCLFPRGIKTKRTCGVKRQGNAAPLSPRAPLNDDGIVENQLFKR